MNQNAKVKFESNVAFIFLEWYLSRKALHPVWQELQQLFAAEYSIKPKQVRGASIAYRYKPGAALGDKLAGGA